VLLIDCISTLVNVAIVDPTQVDLISHVILFHKVVGQTKEGFYHN
jgi:hypothetical protein